MTKALFIRFFFCFSFFGVALKILKICKKVKTKNKTKTNTKKKNYAEQINLCLFFCQRSLKKILIDFGSLFGGWVWDVFGWI